MEYNIRFLPPGSYLNFQEFGIKKLGAIVDFLIRSPQTYDYLFDWKNHYTYSVKPRSDICDLCTKLNDNEVSPPRHHFRHWWYSDYKDVCDRLKIMTLLNWK
nr:uncharacterized protein LOC128678817 isoform X2 [Plodia interpunctella]